MNLNRVFLIGRVTADPELRTTPNGQSVSTFSVATNRTWTGKTGNKEEEVEFHNIVVWARQAEIASQFLKKGQLVYIEGRIRTRTWQDKQGQNRRTTEIICERFQFGPKAQGSYPTSGSPQTGQGAQSGGNTARPEPMAPKDDAPTPEELPVIDLESEEVKAEDLPF